MFDHEMTQAGLASAPSSRFLPQPPGPAAEGRIAALLAEGHAKLDAFRLDEAEPYLREALALAPADPAVLLAMARLYQRRGTNPDAQLDYAFRVVRSDYDSGPAHKLFALASRALGLEPLAIGHLRRCLDIDRGDANACFHLGLTLLQFGHWEEGWRTYEQRPTQTAANGYVKPAPPGLAEWRGEDLRGRSIVLLGEDGHGDQIQNLRFACEVLARGPRRLILDVRPSLQRLFLHALAARPGGAAVAAARLEDCAGDVDYGLAFGSMGGRFGANAANLAAMVPYLRPAATPPPRSTDRLRIGIAWRGHPHLESDRVRSIPLAVWAPLLDMARPIDWVSLQHDDHKGDEPAIIAAHGVATPLGSAFDYLDTADVIATLDLVIAVDTSVVHLAGAMGKPVWLLNRATGEWRWGWKARTSPWYPTLTIFHQEKLLDWAPVIAEVRERLDALI